MVSAGSLDVAVNSLETGSLVDASKLWILKDGGDLRLSIERDMPDLGRVRCSDVC